MSDFSWLSRFNPESGTTTCLLCPHNCTLKPGETGICQTRKAEEREITPLRSYPVTAVAVDPIEKKPFYHYLPGSRILSVGFSGCNLKCPYCQNWHIAQTVTHQYSQVLPSDIPGLCREHKNPGCAFTYSEPLIHYEYLMDAAEALHREGLKALLVTNGYINSMPGEKLAERMDAVKVDLKGFTPEWYKKELKGGLSPVKEFIRICAEKTHLEVVTLIIPGKNDSLEEIEASSRFLGSISRSIPYHLTAYYPNYHYSIPQTKETVLLKLAAHARENLDHVYTGNLGLENPTFCSSCGKTLIDRTSGSVSFPGLEEGVCRHCRTPLYGCF